MMKQILSILVIVMIVASGRAIAGNFTDNGNGTVTDLTTNLMWQKCSAGQNNDVSCTGTASTYQWEGPTTSAISYCDGLSLSGYTDWRLPNIKELRSIVDSTRVSAAVDVTKFPATVSAAYWSSTTEVSYTTIAWSVQFGNGRVDCNYKTNTYYVRCVRGQ